MAVNNEYRNFPMVPRVVFGKGSFNQLTSILDLKRKKQAPFIFIVDDVFNHYGSLVDKLELKYNDKLIFASANEEPKTSQVDALVKEIGSEFSHLPSGIIGIGGGSIMDLAKAVSLMLTNEGSAADYQGWDLIKTKKWN